MKHHRVNTEAVMPLGLISITILSAGILVSTYASADDSIVDQVNVTVAASCTLSGTGMDSHNAEITNGTYRDNIGTTTLKAFCNDSEGFAIYAIGFTGDQYTGEDHTKLIGVNNNQKITTGTLESGPTSNWAMKLETSSSATYPISLDNGYGSYSTVPDTYTKVAHRNSSTDVGTSATGAELTTTYAAYISSTQVADTYTGKVKYTLVHPASEEPLQPRAATPGCINYFANASNALGTMGCQPASNYTSVVLLASNFSREGYGFAGWSDAYDYASNPNAHFYGPQQTYSVPANVSTYGQSLYAVWIKSRGSLQDTKKVKSLCVADEASGGLVAAPARGTASLDSVSALTDSRDDETYAIAKLADGKCWMIENLRLEAEGTRDSEKQALAQGYGTSSTYGNFVGLADPEHDSFPSTYAANSLYYSGTQEGTASINIGTGENPAYRMPRYNNINTPTDANERPQYPTSNEFANDSTIAAMYSYGNYYSWHAAIANTAYLYYGDSKSTSLCPLGWKLPTGKVDGDFGGLSAALGGPESGTASYRTSPTGNTMSSIFRSFPNNFIYSGSFISGPGSRGWNGHYWTSSIDTPDNSNSFGLNRDVVEPGTENYYKYYGFSIRCVSSA